MRFVKKVQKPLMIITLVSILALAFFCRLMSNIRYETVIHEFDPYFQYKTAIYLNDYGNEEFSDWMDDRTWYPLSRVILPTMYPGLQYTATFFVKVCQYVLHLPITILQACSYMGPVMSVIGTLFSFDFGLMIDDSDDSKFLTGLLSALLFSIIPGFIQRSVAGSYDNESNSITAMVAGFDLWLRACGCADKKQINTSINTISPILAAIAFFYMGFSWGGFAFILCLVPLHVFVCFLSGSLTKQIKAAFMIWMPVGYTLMNLVWREYGFVFKQSIALPGIGVFFLLAGLELLENINKLLTPTSQIALKKYIILLFSSLIVLALPVFYKVGLLSKITGRFLSFISPTHAKSHNPLVASVSEHQPTIWSNFYFNTWFLPVVLPIGFYFGLLVKPSTGSVFMIIYLTTTTWFSAVMSRMILLASPAAAACGGYVISKVLQALTSIKVKNSQAEQKKYDYMSSKMKLIILSSAVALISSFIFSFTQHSLWCAKYVYSQPSIVILGSGSVDGEPTYIDDFREVYAWLEHNTHKNARVGFWWDYGYQVNQVGDKQIYVDNMTRSPYWIGLMGAILSSPEPISWRICKDIGVDYMLVLSGAASGYNGDDIGKFMWPIRISGNNHFELRQGYEYFRSIKERSYYNEDHEYRVDQRASHAMKNSMMYKFIYHKLDEQFGQDAKDMVRNSTIDMKYANKMDLFQEVYSSERLIVRVYKVKDATNF
ncbi:Dolichyl-diphosphooligosaccharide--protein glycosyltransferase [Spironucleus salmonicida]|uniref:dolichyl-diphosphooligosaccharide--protein glycotransferase n=1 Tax=Spironucleus salmonicida TaxID=348837 RepID=V6LZL6_9EUKA|nr:Dolichyl-diphosphooligosaccharide--protein glycosyltransferase [Spironucleus salmonicida]|eukprot:EST49181.1 Oligosaccharyl transferase STT3 subunit [Spironucleus salmonicida]